MVGTPQPFIVGDCKRANENRRKSENEYRNLMAHQAGSFGFRLVGWLKSKNAL
jgi:hypothetical protein